MLLIYQLQQKKGETEKNKVRERELQEAAQGTSSLLSWIRSPGSQEVGVADSELCSGTTEAMLSDSDEGEGETERGSSIAQAENEQQPAIRPTEAADVGCWRFNSLFTERKVFFFQIFANIYLF